jgi:hypothetical protein
MSNAFINLCGPLVSYECGNNTNVSACLEGFLSNTSIGAPSSQLTLEDSQVSLLYESGDKCPYLLGSHYQSIINFVCDATTDGSQGPEYSSKSLCSYFFRWRTRLVCDQPTQVPCIVDSAANGIYADLSSLRRSSNWVVEDPNTGNTYEINVCQSLVQDSVGYNAILLNNKN